MHSSPSPGASPSLSLPEETAKFWNDVGSGGGLNAGGDIIAEVVGLLGKRDVDADEAIVV